MGLANFFLGLGVAILAVTFGYYLHALLNAKMPPRHKHAWVEWERFEAPAPSGIKVEKMETQGDRDLRVLFMGQTEILFLCAFKGCHEMRREAFLGEHSEAPDATRRLADSLKDSPTGAGVH